MTTRGGDAWWESEPGAREHDVARDRGARHSSWLLPPELTQAEREVVHLALDGHTNVEIAQARGTSPHTVANQLRTAYSKLEVAGRVELPFRCLGERRP